MPSMLSTIHSIVVVIIDRHCILTLKPLIPKLSIALHVADSSGILDQAAAAALFLSVVEFAILMIEAESLVASRRKRQKVEYCVAFVSGMLEVIAVAGGTEAYFASGREARVFVFGFVLDHGWGRDGACALAPGDLKAVGTEPFDGADFALGRAGA